LLIAAVVEVLERREVLRRGREEFLQEERTEGEGLWGKGFGLGPRSGLVGWLLAQFGLDLY